MLEQELPDLDGAEAAQLFNSACKVEPGHIKHGRW